jgi:hypothetical protein
MEMNVVSPETARDTSISGLWLPPGLMDSCAVLTIPATPESKNRGASGDASHGMKRDRCRAAKLISGVAFKARPA